MILRHFLWFILISSLTAFEGLSSIELGLGWGLFTTRRFAGVAVSTALTALYLEAVGEITYIVSSFYDFLTFLSLLAGIYILIFGFTGIEELAFALVDYLNFLRMYEEERCFDERER